MRQAVHVLCAGAAKGLVQALQARFEAAHGTVIDARFDAVGALKSLLVGGAPCDVMVTTAGMVEELAAAGLLRGDTAAVLGRVSTGLAVRSDAPLPRVSTPEALSAALRAAQAIYLPDPAHATAGRHFVAVLQQLGLHDELAPRLRPFANGATAMRALAAATESPAIGCTQVTEIRYTEGVAVAGALPGRLALSTVYSAALTHSAARPAVAMQLRDWLSGEESLVLRRAGGFEM